MNTQLTLATLINNALEGFETDLGDVTQVEVISEREVKVESKFTGYIDYFVNMGNKQILWYDNYSGGQPQVLPSNSIFTFYLDEEMFEITKPV